VEDLTRPEHLYKLKVESFLKESAETWKPFVRDTPVFRNQHGKVLQYDTYRKMFWEPGREMGFHKDIKSYCLRRATENVANGKAVSFSVKRTVAYRC